VYTELAGVYTELAGVYTELAGVYTELAGVYTELTKISKYRSFLIRMVGQVDKMEMVMGQLMIKVKKMSSSKCFRRNYYSFSLNTIKFFLKVETVLNRLDTMQMSKTMRQANMARILDGFIEYPESKYTVNLSTKL
jgi:hypothetical protein